MTKYTYIWFLAVHTVTRGSGQPEQWCLDVKSTSVKIQMKFANQIGGFNTLIFNYFCHITYITMCESKYLLEWVSDRLSEWVTMGEIRVMSWPLWGQLKNGGKISTFDLQGWERIKISFRPDITFAAVGGSYISPVTSSVPFEIIDINIIFSWLYGGIKKFHGKSFNNERIGWYCDKSS